MFKHKIVAVLNKTVEPGRAMNALGHMSISLGAQIGVQNLELVDYHDCDDNLHPQISKMPFMVLCANSNKIRNCRQQAKEHSIQYVDFIDTMTIGTWQEQVAKTQQTKDEDLNYFGIVLFGPWDIVTEMTRKFSLWK